MRPLLAAAFALIALPALADTAQGTVKTFDPASGMLILEDGTVWTLGASATPQELLTGAEVILTFTAGTDSTAPKVTAVEKL
ncbi:hypothetical protein [Tropicibacter naphthalenivorans]|uniref:DUF1344 domain-containing protein n=1 Tax=Tropicibacter naphthalenivorans TaxID=441103 RepID=A0A0P1GAR0_9RHOB|nr:hypothetical protein [Tropicibacter naphthalenivorans]CUH78608.1 hypothetical protein TRN7648_02071 [Tropicibacter naphthalenivorans]SMC81026.1 hypothetical protein SAMN04488093_104232 [Tropicibacter naphthalenivorans]